MLLKRALRRASIAATLVALIGTAAPATPASALLPPIPCLGDWVVEQLSGISIVGATLSPSFDPLTYDYDATLPNGTTTTRLTVSASYADALLTYSINGSKPLILTSGVASNVFSVIPGATVNIRIGAGLTTSTCVWYTDVALTREPGEVRLAGLTFSPGGITPSFVASTTSYAATIAADVSSVLVTPTTLAPDSSLQMKVGTSAFTSIASGFATGVSIPAGQATTTILIRVTAADGVTTRDYSIAVTRSSAPVPPSKITVPNVKGLRLKAAKMALKAVGFHNFRVVYVYNAKVAKGVVVRATKGQRVADALITIRVSKGPKP